MELTPGASAGGGAITFSGSSGVLRIDGTTMPANAISGFAASDTIDLTGISATSASVTGSVMTVTESSGGTVSLNVTSASGTNYYVASDGSGGTDIVAYQTLMLSQVQSYEYVIGSNAGTAGILSAASGSYPQLLITGGPDPPSDNRSNIDPTHSKIVLSYIDVSEAAPWSTPGLFTGGPFIVSI